MFNLNERNDLESGFENDLESGCLWQAVKTKKYTTFGTNNCSKVRTYTVLKTPCPGNIFWKFWIKILQNTLLKRKCIKIQHTNNPDQIGPSKSYIYVYRVKKP